jgi:flagellar biogenesis protein FliO
LLSSITQLAVAAEPNVITTKHEDAARELPDDVQQTTESTPAYAPQWPEPPNTGALLMRLFIGTGMILVLGVGTIWFGKPWLQRLQVAGNGNSNLQIEGSIAIGNRAMLYLVRAGETQLIAGTDASGLKSLVALPATFKDVLEARMPDVEEPVPPQVSSIASANVFRFGGKE